LLCAVQDLYDLYLRIAPCGPYRLPLFQQEPAAASIVPPGVSERAQPLDALIRGVSCLLANQLPDAALPVIAELWRQVQAVEALWLPGGQPAAYYAFLTRELHTREPDTAAQACRLFGEVLAVYVDVLCLLRLPKTDGVAHTVQRLRDLIAQAGVKSSSGGSASGGVAGPP
jgi:hypothetical protein